jgi:hypothetical protein
VKVRPFRTLVLRTRLKGEGRLNQLQLRVRWHPDNPPRVGSRGHGPIAPFDTTDALITEIHPYALIGHQLTGWISGYLWAKDLGIEYRGGALSRDTTGLFNLDEGSSHRGANHDTTSHKSRGKRIRLPPVPDERSPLSIGVLRSRVERGQHRFPKTNRIYRLSLDQARWDLTPAADVVRRAVLCGNQGRALLDLESGQPYVAVHIRRGPDIAAATHGDRWLADEWYLPLVRRLKSSSPLAGIPIYIYALGTANDFPLLAREPGVELRLNGQRDADFTALCAAKLLVAAPSSFSFTAALVSTGAILARVPWWHHIPSCGRWVHLDEHGECADEDLDRALAAANGGLR